MLQRYFHPDFTKIESLRIKHGLTVKALAQKANISRRTLNRLAKDEGVLMGTVEGVAKALGVSVDSLLPGYLETVETQEERLKVNIGMEIPIKSLPDSAQRDFMGLLKALLQSMDKMKITSVAEGCTIVTLDMSERDAIRLIYLALNTKDDHVPNRALKKSLRPYIRHQMSQMSRNLRAFLKLELLFKRSAGLYSEEFIAALISEARETTKESLVSEAHLSFQVEENAMLLQKQPALGRDLRRYRIANIELVLSDKLSSTHQGKKQ